MISAAQRFWIVAFLATAAVLAAGLVAFTALAYVKRTETALAHAWADLARLEERRHAIRAASALLTRLGREEEIIRSAFADPADPLALIESVEGIGRRSELKVELALASGSAGASGRGYTVSVSGPYHRVMAFLQHLEALPFLIAVGDIEIRLAEVGSQPAVRLAATFTIVTP
jgi:Tfp pilus assembly protein PilO